MYGLQAEQNLNKIIVNKVKSMSAPMKEPETSAR